MVRVIKILCNDIGTEWQPAGHALVELWQYKKCNMTVFTVDTTGCFLLLPRNISRQSETTQVVLEICFVCKNLNLLDSIR